MQQTGCLKKRRRRNISKVPGLGLVEYDAESDTYRGLDIYNDLYDDEFDTVNTKPSKRLFGDSIGITISAIREARRNGTSLSSSTRITRDPTFSSVHMDDNDEDDDNNGKGFSSEQKESWELGEKSADVLSRPNLLDSTVMARLRQLLLLGTTSGAFPWNWNKKTVQIDKWPPWAEKLWVIMWFFVTIQTAFLTGFQFYSFYSRVKGETKTYREVFMNSLSVYWYVCAIYFNFNMYIYKDHIRQYINTMLLMNKSFCGKKNLKILNIYLDIFVFSSAVCLYRKISRQY